MSGCVFMANLVIALLFARFYRRTRDRLFAVFAIAFIIMAVNSLLLVFYNDENVGNPYFYSIRLIAFLCIIVAILDKNRKSPTI
jgi:peptidoglycan/LPS O-acetylase OafA/YrhL